MSKKNIEVELRGPLNESDYDRLMKYLNENGVCIGTQRRLFFDLSQTIGINNRTLDVRAKITNGIIQIVVKRGWHGSVSREEAAVTIESGNLQNTFHVLSLLGYSKGIYGIRNITKYVVGEIEYAIQDVICVDRDMLHSRFYEIEVVSDSQGQERAEQLLRDTVAQIPMEIFDRERWNAYEACIDSEANGWFDFSSTDIDQFIKYEE